jgi:hypothetical protein
VRRASPTVVVHEPDDQAGVVYEIVLLAGTPLRRMLRLPVEVAEGASIEVDGEEWTVADVRSHEGASSELICIYAA